ncbi:MAG: F0F1 ATP synthase subunit alpha [bacterium]
MINIPIIDITEVGYVTEVKHDIIKVSGLNFCVYGQLVQFSDKTKGMIMGYTPEDVLIIAFGSSEKIVMGDEVVTLTEVLSIPVGDKYLGRVVNSLGKSIDDSGDIESTTSIPIFREAPGVMERVEVVDPLLTGVKTIDMNIPIGKGQRELIIGDRRTGKSSLCLDTIINQRDKDVICIYCWIGGSFASLKNIVYALLEKDALDHTIILSAAANTSAGEQYLAPYAAAAIGEYFVDKGKDVFVVFDDLTKHAWMYRQISLLMERSPGREAYPGDIFYAHSSLLERAGNFRDKGTMTFFPVVEALQGDITGYIQTNIISITDGQIYLNLALFHEGFKPAIDLGLSVSRIGSKVQYKAIKEVSSGLRLEYVQYRELLSMTKLNTKLSSEAQQQLKRGNTLCELFIQSNNQPISFAEEVILFYAFKRRILEALPAPTVKRFKDEFFSYLTKTRPEIIGQIWSDKNLSEGIKTQLDKLLVDFFK